VLAFAGIGLPEKLRATLERSGAIVEGLVAFPDHHPFSAGDMVRLARLTERRRLLPVTTAKDALRLPPAWRGWARVLEVRLAWREPVVLEALLDRLPASPLQPS
jgi:tetraacyldisaccharide 4'-kinase